jgi:hypothetical protein
VSDDAIAPLVELAAAHNAHILDLWGRSTLTIRDDIDLGRVMELSERPGFTVQLLFGDSDTELTLGSAAPDGAELAALASLLGNERERSELAAVPSVLDAEQLLHADLTGAFIEYARSGWVRTESAFLEAVQGSWTDVVKGMSVDSLLIGDTTVVLDRIAGPNPPGALPVAATKIGTPVSAEVSTVLTRLADGAAWTQLAVSARVLSTDAFVALHNDQDTIVRIRLDKVAGGTELLRWRMSGDDANRDESLRHVLRFVTASSHTLPDARTVQRLAERQRIALVRDRAAEVFRAIADGQRSTAQLLETAAASLSQVVEDTMTTASALIAGVIGLVALVAQNATRLPGWLVFVATGAAVLGVVAVIVSRWRRIGDQKQASDRLLERLRDDPLLPPHELRTLEVWVSDFKLSERADRAGGIIVVLGTSACAVALAAASWLVWAHHPKGTVPGPPPKGTVPGPPPTTSSTVRTGAPPTSGPG